MSYSTGSRTVMRATLLICTAALCTICAGMSVSVAPADAFLHCSAAGMVSAAIEPAVHEAVSDETGNTAADHQLTDEELELLARVISAEARGESYDGQVAVGAVVLNRMEHPDFPDSLEEVCWQKGAFDGVSSGQIGITPGESCLLAAADAASGRDPTGGALYFYNPDATSDSWIRSLQIVTVIGRHCFCV